MCTLVLRQRCTANSESDHYHVVKVIGSLSRKYHVPTRQICLKCGIDYIPWPLRKNKWWEFWK